MSQSLKKLGRKLDELNQAGRALINEGAEAVQLSALSASDGLDLATLAGECGLEWDCENAADGVVDLRDGFDAALEPYRLTIRKPAVVRSAVILTLVGLQQWLEKDGPGNIVRHVQTDRPFATLARHFVGWNDATVPSPRETKRRSPRDLVRESGDPSVPERIEPWLLDMPLSHMPIGDPVFDVWARLSLPVALRSLASEILADGTIVYAGPPKLKLAKAASLQESNELLLEYQRALRWVFDTEHQSEIRHGLMGAELSRHSIDGAITAGSLQAALEGDKIAYQLSLTEISRDSLKAIADVRKAVSDEINKTADTARQLATAVAGAVFLGLGVVAARVTSSAPPSILIALSVVLAAYVGSIIYASAHFMRLQDKLRSDWKQRFFSFLGTDDYKKLVTDPLAEAKHGFVVVAWVAGLISLAMVAGIIVLMSIELDAEQLADQAAMPLVTTPDLGEPPLVGPNALDQ